MTAAATTVDWPAAQKAVAEAGTRFTALLRSVTRPDAPALGHWSSSQVAVHVSIVTDAIWAMTRGGGNVLADVWDLPKLSQVLIDGEGRRTPAEMADRIDASVARFLAAMKAAGEDTSHSWLIQGTEMPLSTLTCHILNELTIHGLDIARAEGVPWPIDKAHATLIVQGFFFSALHTLGRAMVVQDKAGNARFEIRLRADGRAWVLFADGNLSVEASPQGPGDCHLSVDPAAFLLVSWGRTSQWPGIAKGQLLAWGRKPWLGMQMRSWLRNP